MARAIKITSVSGALTVTITGPNGGTPVVYADSSFVNVQSMPATVADATTSTFWLQGPGKYTLSVKTSGGTEIAADNNSTRTVDLETAGSTAALNYDARTLATIAGDSGHSTAGGSAASSVATLSDVVETSLTDGDVLAYNGGTSKWNNKPGVKLAQAGQTPSQAPVAPGTSAVGALGVAALADHVHPSAGVYGFTGPGTDGAIVFDGTTNFNTFSSRSGTTYTLLRDFYGTNVTVNAGVTIICPGFAFNCAGTLTVQATGSIVTPSADGSGATAQRSNTFFLGTGAQATFGMYGQNGGTGVGTAASGFNSTNFAGGGGAGAGGAGTSGAGGSGLASGVQTHIANFLKRPPFCFTGIIMSANINGNGSIYGFMGSVQGGAGGASGAGDGTNSGGAGGSGGGVLFVNATKLAGAGTISTPGGAGGTPSAGNCGGGGGGGGGLTVVNTTDISGWTGTVASAPGAGGGKTGTGVVGSAGLTGIALLNVLT